MAKDKDQQEEDGTSGEKESRFTPEFWLVVVLVIALGLLIVWVTRVPVLASGNANFTAADEIEYRKHSMSLILTAFGAWIAAGAAYFFGRESQKGQQVGMLKSQQATPKSRLHGVHLSIFHLWELSWRVSENTEVKKVIDTLTEKPRYWFVPVLSSKGELITVLYHKAFYNFLDHHYDGKNDVWKMPYDQILKRTVKDVIDFVNDEEAVPAYRRVKLIDIYVSIKMDMTVGEASEKMNQQDKRLAVVFDDSNKPTHFIDTNDIRRFLLSIDE